MERETALRRKLAHMEIAVVRHGCCDCLGAVYTRFPGWVSGDGAVAAVRSSSSNEKAYGRLAGRLGHSITGHCSWCEGSTCNVLKHEVAMDL